MSVDTPSHQPDFDPDVLRDKYREERDKRLRADGNDQYIEVTDRVAHFLEDPFAPDRPPAPTASGPGTEQGSRR